MAKRSSKAKVPAESKRAAAGVFRYVGAPGDADPARSIRVAGREVLLGETALGADLSGDDRFVKA